jgi:hypothetical protein
MNVKSSRGSWVKLTRNKEQGTRRKEQGTRRKEQGTRIKDQGGRKIGGEENER